MEKNPINFDASEKRLSFVYNSDVSGFQPLDFGKLNNLEDVLINFSGFGINVHQDDLNPIMDSVSVSGSLYEVISGFDTFGINVHQDDLTASTDFVTAVPERSSTISNFIPSGTNGTVLQANANRKQLFVQNMSTSHLHIKYGATAASNSFNFNLASSTNAGGGDGGTLSDLNYTGIVSVSGVSPNYISWERT
jgi:hypothetical protein